MPVPWMHFSLPLSRAVQRVIAFYPENLRPIITLEARQAATVYAKAAAERVREESLPLCVPAVRSHAHLITTGKQLERERGRTDCLVGLPVSGDGSPVAVTCCILSASASECAESHGTAEQQSGGRRSCLSWSGETAARASFSLSLSRRQTG